MKREKALEALKMYNILKDFLEEYIETENELIHIVCKEYSTVDYRQTIKTNILGKVKSVNYLSVSVYLLASDNKDHGRGTGRNGNKTWKNVTIKNCDLRRITPVSKNMLPLYVSYPVTTDRYLKLLTRQSSRRTKKAA